MLRVRVFGGVAAEVDGRAVREPTSRRASALLGWLAVHPGLHSRADVAARLWPDVVDASARQSMRSALWSLRQVLDSDAPAALITTRDRVGLAAGTAVDAVEFDALVSAGRFADAAALGDGELLAGVDDEWALIARDEHRLRVIEVLGRVADDTKDAAAAAALARRAVALDPLSEEAGRSLMARLDAMGDRPAALAAYQRLAARLRRELRVAPSEPTWQLAEKIRTHIAPAPTSRSRPGLLPLVGREVELRSLVDAWTSARTGRAGLALVHGDPGMGKTRLVTQLADHAAQDGAVVATGAAPDLAGPPLSPWVEVCATLVRSLGELPDSAWVLALAALLPAHIRPGVADVAPGMEQARLSEAVVALFDECARRGPVLVVLEDLHAADEASLAMLSYVTRRVADARVLVVATRRERPLRDRLVTLEHASRQGGTVRADVALGPLNDSAISDLARAVGTLTEEAVSRVVGAADGNALLAVEAARALVIGDALPVGLRGAVRAASARLTPDARELVRTLAVAGRDVAAAEAAERAGVALADALTLA
ncbi:MAG: AAA family ATPase, partial [Actinomycetota bacterium]|nr:AAA family ATPase [Actinomycetota bacterium]